MPASRPRTAARDDGLTLIEMTVALLLISVVALMAAYAMIGAMKARALTETRDKAYQFANEQIERVRMLPWGQLALSSSDTSGGSIPSHGAGGSETMVTVAATTPFKRQFTREDATTGLEYTITQEVTFVPLAGSPGVTCTDLSDPKDCGRRASVRVSWEMYGRDYSVESSTVRSASAAEQAPSGVRDDGSDGLNNDCIRPASEPFCSIEVRQGAVLIREATSPTGWALKESVGVSAVLRDGENASTIGMRIDEQDAVHALSSLAGSRTWTTAFGAGIGEVVSAAPAGMTPGRHTLHFIVNGTVASNVTVDWHENAIVPPVKMTIVDDEPPYSTHTTPLTVCATSSGVTSRSHSMFVDVYNVPLTGQSLRGVQWTLGKSGGTTTTPVTSPAPPASGGGANWVTKRFRVVIPTGTPLGMQPPTGTPDTNTVFVASTTRVLDGGNASVSLPVKASQC